MNQITAIIKRYKQHARQKRGNLFKHYFKITPQTRILDLGSHDGAHIALLLRGTNIMPANVYIADVVEAPVKVGQNKYGFTPVVIRGFEKLPFPDNFFDIVFCNSAIEHVTVSPEEIWRITSGREFKARACPKQHEFAAEIQRVGQGYFVQTPYRWFPITSHIWLPLVGWLPRRLLVPTIRFTNRFWIKKTEPDWYLLNKKDLTKFFPQATILTEKSAGFTKSIIAVYKNHK